jgi:hypothetical protein
MSLISWDRIDDAMKYGPSIRGAPSKRLRLGSKCDSDEGTISTVDLKEGTR